MNIAVEGVHPVDASEPVHLVVAAVSGATGEIDICEFTQEIAGQPRSEWQVPCDERFLLADGSQTESCPDGPQPYRLVFFFHYLDLSQPLLTPAGAITLPPATPTPEHLRDFNYAPP